jgi:trimethylamine--corrinoid protein Co-methyltransferase
MDINIPFSQVLTEGQIQQVHETSLRILEEVEVSTDSEAILKACERAGARVDRPARNIKINRDMLEHALKTAPTSVTICGRDPDKDMLLQEGKIHFGFGGTGVNYIRDLESGGIRVPTKEDVVEGSRLADALDHFSFVMVLASALDCPPAVQYLHELEAKYNNTTKPIMHPLPGAAYARWSLEMAEAVAGGSEALKKRPMIAIYSEPVAPLFYSTDNEDIFEFARIKAPIIIGPGPILGATGPGTVMGTFAQGIAESLFGVVLAQLANPGTPVVIGNHIAIMDMRTTRTCYAAIEWAMGRAMLAQMARFYGIPCSGQGGCSDAKTTDAQAGAEAALTALISAQSGTNMMHNGATMAGGTLGSFELAVVDNEIYGMLERFLRGPDVNKDTLAFDVIKEVGPEGQFLSHDHTLAFFRKEMYFPRLFDRQSEDAWLSDGGINIFDKAREKAKEIIRTHKVEPLSAGQQASLSSIINEAEGALAKRRK